MRHGKPMMMQNSMQVYISRKNTTYMYNVKNSHFECYGTPDTLSQLKNMNFKTIFDFIKLLFLITITNPWGCLPTNDLDT